MDLTGSIHAALKFLDDSFHKNGHWQEFDTLAGESDLWVTAYNGYQLSQIHSEVSKDLAYRAWKYVRQNRWGLRRSKWAFNSRVPPDADSTTWNVLLATSLNENHRAIEKAQQFLRRHQLANGGIATYHHSGPIRAFTKLNKKISFDGWCKDHTCVTAAFIGIRELADDTVLRYALQQQQPDGHWESYWWTSPAYATGLMVEHLRSNGSKSLAEPIQDSTTRAIEWARSMVVTKEQFNAFDISYLIKILCADCTGNTARLITDLVQQLINHQLSDGSWESSACLQIPPPHVVVPSTYKHWMVRGRGGGSWIFDQHRTFTTSSVANALHKAKQFSSIYEYS